MKKSTITDAVVAVLMERGQPMTAAAISDAILDQGLYCFNSKDIVRSVRSAIVNRCEGSNRKDMILPPLFSKGENRTFWLCTKHYIYSNDPNFLFEKEIESLQILDIEFWDDFIAANDEFNELCCTCICNVMNSICNAMDNHGNQGFFLNPSEIEDNLYSQVIKCLEDCLSGKIFRKVVKGLTVSTEEIIHINLPTQIFTDEWSAIETGRLLIKMITGFLEKGFWKYGLQREDGIIVTDISQWPKPKIDDGNVIWKDSSGFLKPLIWFGLENEKPIACWTLDQSPRQFEMLEFYPSPCSQGTYFVERWCNFWFCDFWTLNWNELLGKNSNRYIIWMFAECAMDEPVEQFNAVRNSCPIKLKRSDKMKDLICKIDQFFMKQISKR